MKTQDFFDNRLPARLGRSPDKANEIGAVYLFKITGEGGGKWTVDCRSTTQPSCVRGDLGNSQCEIDITNSDFQTVLTDQHAALDFYFQGRLWVKGDPILAMKLQRLFALALE